MGYRPPTDPSLKPKLADGLPDTRPRCPKCGHLREAHVTRTGRCCIRSRQRRYYCGCEHLADIIDDP